MMRKLILATLVFMMTLTFSLTCAHAEQNNFPVGEWTIEYLYEGTTIAEQTICIYEDNTFEAIDEEQIKEGTWTLDGKTLTMTSVGEDLNLKWNEKAHQLVGEYNGMEVILRKATKHKDVDVIAKSSKVTGGWIVSDSTTITPEIEQLLWTALDSYQAGTIVTVSYKPVVYLGSQVVAGTNHAILCRASEINKGSSWVIIYLYENLQGDVSVINISNLDFGSLCTYGAD